LKSKEIDILRIIEKDIHENPSSYQLTSLKKVIAQFQNKIADMRQKDPQIQVILQNYTAKELKSLINEIDLKILSIPSQKSKLISILNSLIIQEGKRSRFLEFNDKSKSRELKKTAVKETKSKISITDYEKIRKEWLTHHSLEQLDKEIMKIKMNEIRKIVEPWSIKPSGRKKIDLVDAILGYIKKMRGLSKLGA